MPLQYAPLHERTSAIQAVSPAHTLPCVETLRRYEQPPHRERRIPTQRQRASDGGEFCLHAYEPDSAKRERLGVGVEMERLLARDGNRPVPMGLVAEGPGVRAVFPIGAVLLVVVASASTC